MICNARRWATRASICFVLLILAGLQTADAQTKDFNVPAQSATTGIPEFARQAGIQILVSEKLVRGKQTGVVTGSHSVGEALVILLKGTGLVATSKDGATYTVAVLAASSRDPASTNQVAISSQDFRVAKVGQGVTGPQLGNDPAPKKTYEKDEGLSEIVVTGTNIRGAAPVGSPVMTVSRTDIERSGYMTTQDLLQSIPQNIRGGTAGASEDSLFSSSSTRGFNIGGAGVDLRGLGPSATLVLVNGHREAPSASGYFTDISTIPVSAIDHIDVLTDGASAIYGADAIGGVVNIILKQATEGVETGIRYGDTTRGGAPNRGVNAQLGHQWGDGGVTLSADFSEQGQLYSSERAFTSTIGSPTSLFPSYHQTAVSGGFHQDIGDDFETHADLQYSHKSISLFQATSTVTYDYLPVDTHWGGSFGASYHPSQSWVIRYDFLRRAGVGPRCR